jgi:O-antigen/teichoic acid export membrane protein
MREMQRKFVTNLALVIFLNLLIKPFWILGIDRLVQKAVGLETYGFYYALFNFSFLLNIILDFGITTFNNKNIAQHNHLLNKHLSSIIVLRMILAIIFAIVTMTAGLIIGYTTDMLKMLIVLVFNQALLSFILYLRSNLSGLHLFKTDSIISVTDRLIMIVICAFLLVIHYNGHPFDIRWFVYAQTAGYIITLFLTLMIVIDKAKLKKLTWRFSFFLMVFKQSYPYAVLVLLMTFYNRIDGVMLERLLPDGAEQAGIYASAYRLLDSANMIAFLFAGLLLPIFARMIKLKESVETLVHLAFCLLVIPAFIVGIASWFYSKELMTLLYDASHVTESALVFRKLMFCFIPISCNYIFGTLLTANGNLKYLNILAASGMCINIALNFYLIPIYKAEGSAVVSLITQSLIAVAQILLVKQIFKFHINSRLILSSVAFLLLTVLICILTKNLVSHWLAGLILAGAASIGVAFLFRIISLKNIYRLVRYE